VSETRSIQVLAVPPGNQSLAPFAGLTRMLIDAGFPGAVAGPKHVRGRGKWQAVVKDGATEIVIVGYSIPSACVAQGMTLVSEAENYWEARATVPTKVPQPVVPARPAEPLIDHLEYCLKTLHDAGVASDTGYSMLTRRLETCSQRYE
jgi:hypothetical protein